MVTKKKAKDAGPGCRTCAWWKVGDAENVRGQLKPRADALCTWTADFTGLAIPSSVSSEDRVRALRSLAAKWTNATNGADCPCYVRSPWWIAGDERYALLAALGQSIEAAVLLRRMTGEESLYTAMSPMHQLPRAAFRAALDVLIAAGLVKRVDGRRGVCWYSPTAQLIALAKRREASHE